MLYQDTYSTKYGDKQVEAATTFDINKTIMRCLVKNLAMFGLGIYIYAGEDLPDSEPVKAHEPLKKDEPVVLVKGSDNWNKVVAFVKANKDQGIESIGKKLNAKYVISTDLKKEIVNLCNQ